MRDEQDHYAVLGVPPDADPDTVRTAYRALARRLHPDVSGGQSQQRMSEVNRAWETLSDPAARRAYDARRRGVSASSRSPVEEPRPEHRPEHAAGPLPPARIPWRLMLGVVIVGSAVVLTAHARTNDLPPDTPDQLIQVGSCVDINDLDEAVEVRCDGPHDGVVRRFVAIDQTCPSDTEVHRDKQGMGLACVDPAGPLVSEGRPATPPRSGGDRPS